MNKVWTILDRSGPYQFAIYLYAGAESGVWGHGNILLGVLIKAQMEAIIPHLDNMTRNPLAQRGGFGEIKPELTEPALPLLCNIRSPSC